MNKNKNNLIVYSLILLAILAFGVVILPAPASADIPGYVTPYNSTSFNGVSQDYNNYNYYQDSYNPAPANSYIPANYNYSATTANTPTIYSSTADTNTASTVKSTSATTAKAKDTAETKPAEDSSLAASVVLGSGDGFMPSGLIQWIVFAILILLITILTRKIFGAEEKYQSTPMKQA